MTDAAISHVFDATAETFQADVLERSMQVPVLVDFWAEWCGPCKQLSPVLEKLAADYNGAFVLAKVDVDKEQQLGAAFQVRSIPTVFLMKDGQLVDGFPGALPEGQLREFLTTHGVVPAEAPTPEATESAAPEAAIVDPHAEVVRLRGEVAAKPDDAPLRLDLALALLATGATTEAEHLIDALPANLATDDRTERARAHLRLLSAAKDAPPPAVLEAAIAADPGDLRARHLLGVQQVLGSEAAAGLAQFIEMLTRDRTFQDGLPRRALVDSFRVLDDAALVSQYRRRMASLLY